MKQAIITRLFRKQRDGVSHVGFVRSQRFYPVMCGADGEEAPVIEVVGGTATSSGEYMVKFPYCEPVRCVQSFPI